MITWITQNIALCELSDILQTSIENLKKMGFTTVLNVMERNDPKEAKAFRDAWHRGILVRYVWKPVPCKTKQKNKFLIGLNLAYCELSDILFADPFERVLVHCTGGIDRSPFVVASYLVRHENMALEDAYKLIKSKRPWIVEHYEWK